MKQIPRRMVLSAITAMIAAPAFGHSTGELADVLGGKERFFQPLDEETPDFRLSDAGGRLYGPADFGGKVVVLYFVFASCPDLCPLHSDKIAEVQEMVNHTPMKDLVQFIAITTDPANDTPEVMREYGPAHGLDPANWMFLTTAPGQPEDTTRKLVESFGQKFVVEDDGAQIHGAVTHIIDLPGRLRANFYGLRFEPANMVLFINALTNDTRDPHGSSDPGWWEWMKGWFY
jgi:protein SCO1/2